MPTLHRFFIPPGWIRGNTVTLEHPYVHQIRNVLRMCPGDRIIVLDNSGWEYITELRTVNRDQVEGRVIEKRLNTSEPRTKITLYQAVLKGDRFEFVLQKGTEIGVVSFVPLITERCVIGDLEYAEKKRPRWERIIAEAAEQSGRGFLPRLESATLFTTACSEVKTRGSLAIMPWEGERTRTIKEVLRQDRKPFSISVFIGPEGGFSKQEAHLARRYGIIPVTLGPRILRAETAGIVTAAVILYELGDME